MKRPLFGAALAGIVAVSIGGYFAGAAIKDGKADDLTLQRNPVVVAYSSETAPAPTTVSGPTVTITEAATPTTVTAPPETVTVTESAPVTVQAGPSDVCLELVVSSADGLKLKDDALSLLQAALEESFEPAPDWSTINDRITEATAKIAASTDVVEHMTELAPQCFGD